MEQEAKYSTSVMGRDEPTNLAAALIACRASLPWQGSAPSAHEATTQTWWNRVEGDQCRA
jgi:hypothetical protein